MKRLILSLLLSALLAGSSFAATFITYYRSSSLCGMMDYDNINTYTNATSDMSVLWNSPGDAMHLDIEFYVAGSSIPLNSVITSVTLYMFNETAPGDSETIEVSRLSPPGLVINPTWAEYNSFAVGSYPWTVVGGDVNDDHTADITGTPVETEVTTINTTYSWDLTAFWPSTWPGTSTSHSYLVRADEADAVDLDFTDGTVSGNRPRIEVVYGDPVTPTPTSTPTPSNTPTPTATGTPATPTPTMHLDNADELGHNNKNVPVVNHGIAMLEEGYGLLDDAVTGTGIADYTVVYDRDNLFVGNYKNLVSGDFTTAITGWTCDADGEVAWNADSAIDEGNSGCLQFNSASTPPVSASDTISVYSSNTGKMTFSFVYSVTTTVTFTAKVYFGASSSAEQVIVGTSGGWKRAALTFDCANGTEVTKLEFIHAGSPFILRIDNLGLFDAEFDQGFIPQIAEPGAGTTIGGFTNGAVIFSDSSGTLSEDPSEFSYDATDNRLGIGTNSPLTPLHTLQTASSDMAYFQGGDGDASQIAIGNTEDIAYVGTDGTKAYIGMGDAGLAAPNMAIEADGDVGIGTTAPDEDLQVSSTAPSFGLYETDTIADDKKWDLGVSGSDLTLRLANDAFDTFFNVVSIPRLAMDVNSLTLSTSASGAYDFTIGDDGNVGIGAQSSNVGDLEITSTASTLILQESDATASTGKWTWIADGDALKWQTMSDLYGTQFNFLSLARTVSDIDSFTLSTSASGAANFVIDDNGDIGIGTNAPVGDLTITSGGTGGTNFYVQDSDTGVTTSDGFLIGISSTEIAQLWNYENTEFRFATNNAEQLSLHDAGLLNFENDAAVYIQGDTTGKTLALTEELVADQDANTVTVTNQLVTTGISTGYVTFGLTTSPNNNVNLVGKSFVRIATTGGDPTSITGFDEDDLYNNDGFRMVIANVDSADTIRLENADAGSDAENRFLFSTGADIDLAPNETIEVIYDAVTGCFRDIAN